MGSEELGPLFAWGLCQSCMMVSEGWEPTSTAASSCPNCGESTFGLEWPPEPAALLLRQAFAPLGDTPAEVGATTEADSTGALPEYETPQPFGNGNAFEERKDGRVLKEQEEAAVKAFLVATALDVTLEWILKAEVEAFPSDSLEVARLAEPGNEASLTTQQRLDLLREVGNIQLSDIASEQEEPTFPGWWKELCAKRDDFVHAHSMCAFDGLTGEELLDIARMGVKVLAALNNALW